MSNNKETQHKRFLEYYNKIQSGQTYPFVGIHFNAEQYADLADLVMERISYYLRVRNLGKMQEFIEYSERLRARKHRRFFNKELE